MAELIIGAGAATGFVLLVRFVRVNALTVSWWQWGLTVLGLFYGIFVLEVVISFLREGTPKGAAVLGTLMGFVGVVWAVVLGRTVFSRTHERDEDRVLTEEGASHA